MGERSSCDTSDAKRVSRSMRLCTASAISLNERVSWPRSGSGSTSSRVSRPPDASWPAAAATRLRGRSRRREAHQPTPAAARAVTLAAMISDVPTTLRVRSIDAIDVTSK